MNAPAPAPIKGVDFYQAAKPQGWSLEEEVTLPGGQRVTGSKARVYSLLLHARKTNHQFQLGRHLAPPGWVPTWVLREVWAGGAAGDRRLRDLREAGVSIEQQVFQIEEEGSSSWVWRLGQGAAFASVLNPAEKLGKSETVDSPPLSRLSFATGARVLDLEPELDFLRVREVAALAPPACATPESYRTHLLERWRDGSLLDCLAGVEALAFVFESGEEELTEVLARALVALGASRRGA